MEHQKHDRPLPIRTAWHLMHRIREAWEDATDAEPAPPQDPAPKRTEGAGRPPSMRYPEPIPESPENIARALMSVPPKKRWRYLKDEKAPGRS